MDKVKFEDLRAAGVNEVRSAGGDKPVFVWVRSTEGIPHDEVWDWLSGRSLAYDWTDGRLQAWSPRLGAIHALNEWYETIVAQNRRI